MASRPKRIRFKNAIQLTLYKTGIIEIEFGKLYADLMDWRQKGDYGDMFDFTKETVEPLLKPIEEFLIKITRLLNESI